MKAVRALAILGVASFSIVGCANSSRPTTSGSSIEVSSESSAINTTSEKTSASSASTSQPTTTGPIVGQVEKGEKSLTLADARPTSNWHEGSFTTPQRADPVKAIATEVSCYSDNLLEFRFTKQSGKFVVRFAQDLDADSSSTRLEFTLFADGRSVDVKQIAFSESAELATPPLEGVSSVKISVKPVKDSCSSSSSTTALLTSIVVGAR